MSNNVYSITKCSCNSKMASKSQLYHYNSTLDCLAELQLCQQPCRSPFYGMLSPLITLSPFVALPFPGILILVPKLCCNRGCVQCSVHNAKPFLPRFYLKSDNLQYNTLGRWVDRLINQLSDGPSIILID